MGSGQRVRRGKGSGLGGLFFSDEDVRKGGLCVCAWLKAGAHLSCPLAPWHWPRDMVERLGLLCLPRPLSVLLSLLGRQIAGASTSAQSLQIIYEVAPKARYPRLSVLLWSNVLPHSPVFPQLMAGVLLSGLGTTTLIHPRGSSRETKALRPFRREPMPITTAGYRIQGLGW